MKIYIGNLGDNCEISSDDLRSLFEPFGTILECEVVKNFAFVHFVDENSGNIAVAELNGYNLKGRKLRVEKSEPRTNSQKIYVGNLAEQTTSDDLRRIFGMYAHVIEADVLANFGFVHFPADVSSEKLVEIIREMNGYKLHGLPLRVQMSTSNRGRENKNRGIDNGSSYPDAYGGNRRNATGTPRALGGAQRFVSVPFDYREASSLMNCRSPYPTSSFMRERIAGPDEYGRNTCDQSGSMIPVAIGAGQVYDHNRIAYRGGGDQHISLNHGAPGPIRSHDPYFMRDIYGNYGTVPHPYAIQNSPMTYYNAPPMHEMYERRSPAMLHANPYGQRPEMSAHNPYMHTNSNMYTNSFRDGSTIPTNGGLYGMY